MRLERKRDGRVKWTMAITCIKEQGQVTAVASFYLASFFRFVKRSSKSGAKLIIII